MIQSKTITNKHGATISVQVVNDVINTKRILREIQNESDEEQLAKHYDRLNAMWCGSKYSHPIS